MVRSSPYPWIADDVWCAQPVTASDDMSKPVAPDSRAVPVSPADFARAVVVGLAPGLAVPAPGSQEDNSVSLATTRGPVLVVTSVWPVCCERLGTLSFHHGAGHLLDGALHAGTLDDCLLNTAIAIDGDDLESARREWSAQLERVRRGKHSGEGLSMFQCRHCGRVYGTFSEP